MDCSSPGSSVHGIFQARVLEWGAIAFSKPRHGSILNVLTVEWIRKMWVIHTHIYIVSGILLSHKKNEIMLFTAI